MLILTVFNGFNETKRIDWTYSFNVARFEIQALIAGIVEL